jgi:hypothetical protein
MTYGNWKYLEELTIKEFGYTLSSLTYGAKYPIKVICDRCGVIANKRPREAKRRHKCQSIINGIKVCNKCNTSKSTFEFSKNRSTGDGFQKVCKNCFANYPCVKKGYAKKTHAYKTDMLSYFIAKAHGLNDKSRRKLNLPCDLTGQILLEIFEKQNRKCYYSGIEMVHNVGISQYNSISVERKDPNMGYVKDNVVLCAFAINSFKGSLSEEEFKSFLIEVLPTLTKYAASR